MNRLGFAVAVIVVASIAVVGYVLLRSDPDESIAVVERGSIDVTIDTVGTIRLRDARPLRTTVAGTVAALGAEPGDVVAEGDILVLLDQVELDQRVMNAEDLLEAEEFILQFAEARLANDEDSIDLQQAAVAALGRVELARDALQTAREQRDAGAVVADRSGAVLEFFVSPGDIVIESQPVAQIYANEELVLVVDVDELDLPNVRPGASVRFRLDSFPATEVEGTIVSTAPQAIQRGGATLFPAQVQFSIPNELDIRPGMNADVTIVTDLRQNVLLVPESALRTVGRRAFVEVERDGNFEEVEVILGYRSTGIAEVVEGLEEGDRVRLRESSLN
ncbi:N/A [soil metagenome]